MSDQMEEIRQALARYTDREFAFKNIWRQVSDGRWITVQSDLRYLLAGLEAAEAREEADGLFRTVLGWIVEDHPFLVHGYVQGHHALDPIHDLPVFLRAFPSVDYEGWVAKHGEAMDKLAASVPVEETPMTREQVLERHRELRRQIAIGGRERVFVNGKPYRDALCELWDALAECVRPTSTTVGATGEQGLDREGGVHEGLGEGIGDDRDASSPPRGAPDG